jgi:hypothetical protein
VDNFPRSGPARRGLSVRQPMVRAMTNTRKSRLTELSTAVAPVRRRHRELIEQACAWPTGREQQIDPDHFALICAGVDYAAECAPAEVPPNVWTRMSVYHLLRCDIPNWCSEQRCRWPEGLPQELWAWIDFLHGTGRLHPASDPVAELRKPLICCGWLDQDGRPLPSDAPQSIVCECMLPYRETAELLFELVRQCERSGQDPVRSLRSAIGGPVWSPGAGWPPWQEEPISVDLDELWWDDDPEGTDDRRSDP